MGIGIDACKTLIDIKIKYFKMIQGQGRHAGGGVWQSSPSCDMNTCCWGDNLSSVTVLSDFLVSVPQETHSTTALLLRPILLQW